MTLNPRPVLVTNVGLLVIAKDEYSLMHLSDQFRARSVQRTYQSITLGCPSPPSGQVSTNIGRDSADRKKMAAFTTGSSRYVSACLTAIAWACMIMSAVVQPSRAIMCAGMVIGYTY